MCAHNPFREFPTITDKTPVIIGCIGPIRAFHQDHVKPVDAAGVPKRCLADRLTRSDRSRIEHSHVAVSFDSFDKALIG
jgi:hypothetical protein